ncbi:MAG: hypothetical protein DRI98_14990 [Bacteroidetes bacterium]|nr:MAG: hypothetical protein DRI98_14990 [Bacteroidota bacterium]
MKSVTNTILKQCQKSWFQYSIIILLAFFQLFCKLDYLPIQKWDEGKNAVSAYEMLQNKNYLVRHYEGEPDNWGFKPPLLTWHQVVIMKLIGVNELAVRLPSAIYALFTVLLLFRFMKFELKLPSLGIVAAYVLLTSYGYLDRHIARTGDHDSMVVFFLTLQAIYFYKYLKYKDKRNRYLAIVTLALIFGTLTKSVVALTFIPGFLLYTILKGKLKYVLQHRQLYLNMFIYLLVVLGYYLYRELNAPGYLSAVWENELLPRYSNNAENYIYDNLKEYFYYINKLWERRLVPWIYLLPFSIITLFYIKEEAFRTLYRYLLLICVSYLVIISLGVKNIWYDAPMYPLIAIIIAMGIYQWVRFILHFPAKIYFRWSLVILIGVSLIYFSVDATKKLTFAISEKPWAYEEQGINYFLRDNIRNEQNISTMGVAYSGYHSHIRFYMNLLNDSGSDLYFVKYKMLTPNSMVIASENMVKEYIEHNYNCTKVFEKYSAAIYRIDDSRK